MAYFSWGTNFRGFRGESNPQNLIPTKKRFSVWITKENAMSMNSEPHECAIIA